MWPGYMGWTENQKTFFRGMIYTGVENTYEPSDLTVSQTGDNQDQDVKYVPVPVYYSDPNVAARTECDTGSASKYGSHHHRVCDRKQVTVFQVFWDGALTGDQMVYNVLAHEFGHAVGLRHSDSPCAYLYDYCVGTSANGTAQWNTFVPTPGYTSLMYSAPNASEASHSLSLYDYENINLHY